MSKQNTIINFKNVSFEYDDGKEILDNASFSLRRGMKVVLLGQNGAGKTTLFNLLEGSLQADSGVINVANSVKIAQAKQIIPRDQLDMTLLDFFKQSFSKTVYDIEPRALKALAVVNLEARLDKKLKDFSGGQQARILLAQAIIQEPDILLLDEPTNNLDRLGVGHLTNFLINTKCTCVVISHDSDFLKSFSDGLLYLNLNTHKVEQYVGTYSNVMKQVAESVQKVARHNELLQKEIRQRKVKENIFANKGLSARIIAKKMRKKIVQLESEKVSVRQDDKTIRNFIIPCKNRILGDVVNIKNVGIMANGNPKKVKLNIALHRGERLLLSGPNGIGKTTLLNELVNEFRGRTPKLSVGYYSQDFSVLDFEETVRKSLETVMRGGDEQKLRGVAASFLLDGEILEKRVGYLSEGQKGLVSFARLVLQQPELLILDEPTNHINYRHLPVIAEALSKYEGAMILVSHNEDFVKQIKVNSTIDLGRFT